MSKWICCNSYTEEFQIKLYLNHKKDQFLNRDLPAFSINESHLREISMNKKEFTSSINLEEGGCEGKRTACFGGLSVAQQTILISPTIVVQIPWFQTCCATESDTFDFILNSRLDMKFPILETILGVMNLPFLLSTLYNDIESYDGERCPFWWWVSLIKSKMAQSVTLIII
ncbi:9558_t:CDS:2 [Funneliformis caledonium]|uniref:9558_t:CDS:1 n=1 Tax=Funneliformis caledonium TaxID=1117310 RepID=A0A9N9D8J5_9GLOM|nr:9558_t:CDS:2 [Funneliformis caledonium]